MDNQCPCQTSDAAITVTNDKERGKEDNQEKEDLKGGEWRGRRTNGHPLM